MTYNIKKSLDRLVIEPFGGSAGNLLAGAKKLPCMLGRSGVVAASAKQEGDGATPSGAWPCRKLYYRPDRLQPPPTGLPSIPLAPDDLWCDDPGHSAYNQPVKAPFAGNHETLWRADGRYDLIVVLGYNDDPPVAGLGSAIFFHLMEADHGPTAGCIAVERQHMMDLLPVIGPHTVMVVKQASGGCP